MRKIHGVGASGGIAIGTLALYQNKEKDIEKSRIDDTEKELARLGNARKESIGALNAIYMQSLKRVGEKDSMIFQIHRMMIEDEDFSQAIQDKIKNEQVNAEYAVWTVGKEFAKRFSEMDNEYMRERATDVLDISKRLIQSLDKTSGSVSPQLKASSVLAAEDLTPSETMQLDKSRVLAIITRHGSRTSHSAILSRTLGIPSVVGLGENFSNLKDGMLAIVDGSAGDIVLEPDDSTLRQYQKLQNEYQTSREELRELVGTRVIGKNGQKIEINANIGNPQDVQAVLDNGADGIGLFRSEFLYMERDSLPSEEEQFEAYKTVLEKMQGRPVIVRTFDIGADKQVSYLNLPAEANPALGYRAIRICLDRKDLFRTQLRALLRASVFGNLRIMFPMIVSPNEVKAAKDAVEATQAELTAEKTAYAANIKTGIMIETPAAVILSEELAKQCDFFSIGTNDLTQYTLAADRMNGKISKLYDPRHPAVLKMIEMTVGNANQAGIPVGICGESAADLSLTEFYLNIGVSELSVAPSSVLELKKTIKAIAEH